MEENKQKVQTEPQNNTGVDKLNTVDNSGGASLKPVVDIYGTDKAAKSAFKRNVWLSLGITAALAFIAPYISGRGAYGMPNTAAPFILSFLPSFIIWIFFVAFGKEGANGWIVGWLISLAVAPLMFFGGCLIRVY